MTTQVLPRVRPTTDGSTAQPWHANPTRVLQTALVVAGAVMLPLGLIVILLGWYGASHTPYEYDQISYLVSGGLLGLGLTFCGGFLYFGSWMARISADQRDAADRLRDTLLVLADAVAQGAAPEAREAGAVLVAANGSSTVHRADCSLVAGREDLAPVGRRTAGLVPCRLCKPATT